MRFSVADTICLGALTEEENNEEDSGPLFDIEDASYDEFDFVDDSGGEDEEGVKNQLQLSFGGRSVVSHVPSFFSV